jgi:hypothetical protein
MSNPSNLYAEKIFAEHPTSLWALDDAMDYASIVPSTSLSRDLTTWTDGTVNLSVQESLLDLNDPFPNVTKYSIQPATDVGDMTLTLQSGEVAPVAILNQNKETITIGMYVYVDSIYITNIRLGHSVDSGTVSYETFANLPYQQWTFISKTVATPTTGTSLKLNISIGTEAGATLPSGYLVYVNGINIGHWAEEFNATSMGQDLTIITDEVYGLTGHGVSLDGIRAESYGLQDLHGYYIVEDSAALCKNSGIPMAFGASNVSVLYPSSVAGLPSLIIPGLGFLNKSGQYKTFTAEMWLRVNVNTYEERRIFGPIGHYDNDGTLVESTDGLYVSGPFLKLKVGNAIGSHYVSEWNRPMLLDIKVSNNSAALMINGEQVFSISFDSTQLNLPEKVIKDGLDVYENDWLGFFAYEDVPTIEVDCIAIYPYSVPAIMAKRRWIYGQAVEFPNDINTAYSGSSYLIDYSVSGYTNNYNYPELASWNQGTVIENLSLANNYLSAPAYSLPQIVFSEEYSIPQLLQDVDAGTGNAQGFFLQLSSEEPTSYIYLNKLGFLTDQTKAFYGIFDSYSNSEQTLFYLEDGATGNYFEIRLHSTNIVYTLKYNGTLSTVLTVAKPAQGTKFAVGIDIEKFSNYFGGNVKTFFGKSQTLVVYVGNRKDFSKQFVGNIYSLGFCTPKNLYKIAEEFTENGTAQDDIIDGGMLSQALTDPVTSEVDGGTPATTTWEENYDGGEAETGLFYHTATYTLRTVYDLGVLKLDVATDSYWEDFVPLSYFAKYVENEYSGLDYKIDSLQLNVSNPEIRMLLGQDYDTSMSQVRLYVSFQYLSSGANKNPANFTIEKSPRYSNVVIPDSSWQSTRYEVVDNAIIYLPQNVNFRDLAIVLQLEMENSASLSNPIKIKSIQLSPKSLSVATSNPINTKLGKEIYSYAKSGLYYDYAGRNPFTIYKGSTPYLYLTKHSGIELKDTEDGQQTGFSFPINQSSTPKYSVSAMQTAMRVNKDSFATTGISGTPIEPLFELETKDYTLNFYTQAIDSLGRRAKIYAIDTRTGVVANDMLYYINGKIVKDPVINVGEWNILAVSFTKPLNLNGYSGSLRVVGKNILINNLSHYQLTSAQEVITTAQRSWAEVKEPDGSVVMWSYWTEFEDGTWQNVLNLADAILSTVNPEEFYKAYTGTNKKIVEDDSQLTFRDYEYNFYSDISWKSNTITPV